MDLVIRIALIMFAWTAIGMAVISLLLAKEGTTMTRMVKESIENFADSWPEEEREAVREWQKNNWLADRIFSWFLIFFMAMVWPLVVLAVFLS